MVRFDFSWQFLNYEEQLNDPGNFYINDPDNWQSHNDKFMEDQKKLNKVIKAAKKAGCHVPPELQWWLTVKPPSQPRL